MSSCKNQENSDLLSQAILVFGPNLPNLQKKSDFVTFQTYSERALTKN